MKLSELMLMKLSELMLVQGVARWHMVEMSRTQSVAEHSFNVTMIAGEFASHLRTEEEVAAVTMMALLHDVDEVYAGDTPSPTKGKPVLKETFQERAVQIADKLEAYWFAFHYAIGPRRRFVVEDTRLRFKNLLEECTLQEQEVWLKVEKDMHYE